MPDTINSRNPFSIDRRNLNRTDKITLHPRDLPKKADISESLLSYHASSLASLVEPVEEVEEELIVAPPQVIKEPVEVGVFTKMYDYAQWFWGFIAPNSTTPSPTVEVKPASSLQGVKKHAVATKPVSSLPKLQAPVEIDARQLALTMATVNQLIYRLKEISDDGQDQAKFDPNQRRTLAVRNSSVHRKSKTKDTALKVKKESKQSAVKSPLTENVEEAKLYTEFVQLILKEKELSEETLKLLSQTITQIVQINKGLEKVYFNLTDEKIKRNKILKIAKWVEGILAGCLIGGSIAGVVVTVASGGTALVFVVTALQTAGSLSEGSVILFQAVLQHKNRKVIASLYGISLERYQNNKQVEIIFGEFRHALDQVKFSWEELVKLLQQRRRIGKIDV